MPGIDASGPNAEQIKYWNEVSGPKWVALHNLINAQIAPLGSRALERSAARDGERALDVGCGCGETTLDLGRRVGPGGAATGIDISAVMLAEARARAHAAGLKHVGFENADAQTQALPRESYDLLFSRFGVMFFADPTAAFTNLHSALRPGGRLAFICWQQLQDNPWMFVPVMAAAQHISLPPPPAPDAPGPFSFADQDRVRGILSCAGLTNIAFEAVNDTMTLAGGNDLAQTTDFLLQMGPTGAMLREAGREQLDVVAAAVRDAIAPYATPDGVRMSSAAWIVTAEK